MRLILIMLLTILALPAQAQGVKTDTALFAGGCFWSMQKPFDAVPGVVKTVVGFTGGTLVDPTYEQVVQGDTGHYEAVEVTYDPAKVTYERLLYVYWRNIDPVDPNGQFCDKGPQYRTAIFFKDDAQHQKADDSKMLLEADDERFDGKPITTQILAAGPFYAAGEHHQGYYRKNPLRYSFYRGRCGHDQRLDALWGRGAPKS